MRNINKSLTYIFVALMLTGVMSSCTKSAFDELEALTAQKSLLELKFQQEITLEKLRQSGATALEQVKYQFALNTLKFTDSLNANSNRSRDITIYVQEINTTSPLAGATVSIPTTSGTLISAVTDKNGLAFFPENKTTFVPYRASVFVSKEGYASSSVNANNTTFTSGSNWLYNEATVYLWNQDKKVAGNTVKGKVYIDTDLTNTQAEPAGKMLVNLYTSLTINGKEQRIDWSTLTDANGNYSIAVPDLTTDLYFAHNSVDSTSTMYINSIVPGIEGAPSKTAVPATFYLGDNTLFSSGSQSSNNISEQATGVSYPIPLSVGRFYAVSTTPDLNSRNVYIKGLFFNFNSFDYNTNSKSTVGVPSYTPIVNETINPNNSLAFGQSIYFNENYTTTSIAPIKYAPNLTSTPAKIVDLVGDYFTTLPVIQFTLSNGNVTTYTSISAGVSSKIDAPNYTLSNRAYTTSSTKFSTFTSANRSAGFGTPIYAGANNGGKTYTKDLSYGTGKLKTGVR